METDTKNSETLNNDITTPCKHQRYSVCSTVKWTTDSQGTYKRSAPTWAVCALYRGATHIQIDVSLNTKQLLHRIKSVTLSSPRERFFFFLQVFMRRLYPTSTTKILIVSNAPRGFFLSALRPSCFHQLEASVASL